MAKSRDQILKELQAKRAERKKIDETIVALETQLTADPPKGGAPEPGRPALRTRPRTE